MTAPIRFPSTPHLAWLGQQPVRGDKVLTLAERQLLLSHELCVEEKVDGANLGLSLDENGELLAMNRRTRLVAGKSQGQWKPLQSWLARHGDSIAGALSGGLSLFGEWCYAVHSVPYTRLPDWFLAFDVFDRVRGEYWSVERRDALASEVGLATVPLLGRGHFDFRELCTYLGKSTLGETPAEGIYVRRESGGRLLTRAKLVRAEFVQAIDDHWSKRSLKTNSIVRT